MNNGSRNLPSFGINRARRRNKPVEVDVPVPPPRVVQQSSGARVPIVDLQNSQDVHYQVGDLALNTADSLVYYNTGRQWVPLAIMDPKARQTSDLLSRIIGLEDNRDVVIEAPKNGNLRLTAGDNTPGIGGHVHVSAGQGGLTDGEIYLDVGGERAMTLDNTANVSVDHGDLTLKSGKLVLNDPTATIVRHVAHAEVFMKREVVDKPPEKKDDKTMEKPVEKSDDKPAKDSENQMMKLTLSDADLHSHTCILKANLILDEGGSVTGTINNKCLTDQSFVNLTVVNNGKGIPNVHLSDLENGSVKYTVYAVKGQITELQLHLDITTPATV